MKTVLLTILFQFLFWNILVSQGTYTWTGNVSTNPLQASNWNPAAVPPNFSAKKITSEIIIPSGLTRYPIFTTTGWRIGDASLGNGSLTVKPGASVIFSGSVFIVSSRGTLTIESDATGDGMFLYTGSSHGANATVQLHLTGGSVNSRMVFHYFVPPVASMSFDNSSIENTAADLGLTNFIGHLTSFYEPSAVSSQSGGWQFFDGYNGTYEFSSLDATVGYNIHLTDDDKMTFTGQINGSSRIFDLSYTDGNVGAGWNLIGNPFPSNYDLSLVEGLGSEVEGISNVVYYNTNGTYKYFNVLTGIGSSGYSSYVPPMTGFFTLVTQPSTLTFPLGGRTIAQADSRNLHKGSTDSYQTKTFLNKMRAVLSSGTKSDETLILFSENATEAFNLHYDAKKLLNTNTTDPYIYSVLDGEKYFMKSVSPSMTVSVPLTVIIKEAGTHSININEFDFENLNIKLKHGDVIVPLSLGTNYTFNADPGTYSDFELLINNVATGVEKKEIHQLKSWYSREFLYINSPSSLSNMSVKIYDFSGKSVYNNPKLSLNAGETEQIPINLEKGLYLVEIAGKTIHHRSKFMVY